VGVRWVGAKPHLRVWPTAARLHVGGCGAAAEEPLILITEKAELLGFVVDAGDEAAIDLRLYVRAPDAMKLRRRRGKDGLHGQKSEGRPP
jgi:hypothetical protein